jgi:TetR/AcrR family transcriptional regulator, ethionamide resistance regulator
MNDFTAISRRARRGARRPRGDLRELEILDAAERLLGEVGYASLTMDAIAQAVGINRSTLYFYFDSKEAVTTAIVRRLMATVTRFINRLNPRADPPVVIRDGLASMGRLWRDHSVVMRFAAQHAHDHPEVGVLWQGALDASTEAVAALLRQQGLQPSRALARARALTAMTERSFWQLHSAPHTPADERRVLVALGEIYTAATASP